MRSSKDVTVELIEKIEDTLALHLPESLMITMAEIVHSAMEEAWETGNGYDHGMPYSEF
jgi:hypothetical protein